MTRGFLLFLFPCINGYRPRDYQGERVKPHIGPPTKVIPLKLILDIVPSSSADITRALRGCFRGGFMSFLFVSKQRKTSNAAGMSSSIY